MENTSLLGPGLQKEPFLCLLCKQINFISDVISPPPLVDTYPVGPACLSCILTCLDLSGLFKLGAIVFSHVKTLRWDTSGGNIKQTCKTCFSLELIKGTWMGPRRRRSHPGSEQEPGNLFNLSMPYFLHL